MSENFFNRMCSQSIADVTTPDSLEIVLPPAAMLFVMLTGACLTLFNIFPIFTYYLLIHANFEKSN